MTFPKNLKLLLSVLLLVATLSCEKKQPEQTPITSPEAALNVLGDHLAAIAMRDYELLQSTLSPQGDMLLILPETNIQTRVDSFLSMHERWFQDTTWTFAYNIHHVLPGRDLVEATVDVTYREPERGGKPYFNKMAVSYTLRRQGEAWYVVKDHACSLEKSE